MMTERQVGHAVAYLALCFAWSWCSWPLPRGRFWGAGVAVALLIALVDQDR